MASEQELAALLSGSYGGSSRIPADLDQYQRTVSANDIFRLAANNIGSYKVDNSTWSPGKRIAASAAQAFISSLLGSYAQDQEARQIEAVNRVLPQLYSNPESVSAPDGTDRQAFEQLRQGAIRNNAALEMQKQQQDEAMKQRLMLEVFSRDPELGKQYLAQKDPDIATLIESRTVESPTIQQDTNLISSLPKDLRDDVLKEQGILDSKSLAENYIKDQFDKAKKISSFSTLPNTLSLGAIPTYGSDDLAALGPSLIKQLDQATGRETNSDQVKMLLAKTPKWYDSKDRIEEKKREFLDLYNSFSKPTPLMNSLGLNQSTMSVSPSTQLSPELISIAKQEASSLRAKGYSSDAIAAHLRNKYSK